MRKIILLSLALLALLCACGRDPLADAQTIVLEDYATVTAPSDWACKLYEVDTILCQSADPTHAVFRLMPAADALPGAILNETSLASAIADFWPSGLIADMEDMAAVTIGGLPAFRQCFDTSSEFHCCAAMAGQDSAPVFISYCAVQSKWRSYNRVFEAMLEAVAF